MTEMIQPEMIQPNQTTYQIDDAGNAVLAGLSSGATWGPGQGYPYAWDSFLNPRTQQPGTWRAARYNWRTGGVLLQLGTDGNFGPIAFAQAGWVRKRFTLGLGRNDFRITYRMGPVTERPDPARARGQVYALLVSNVSGVRNLYASSELPAGGVVTLNLSSFIPGHRYDLYVGCTNILHDAGRNPYCEVIVNDIKVHHTHSPYYAGLEGDTQRSTQSAADAGLQAELPAGVEIPELVAGLFDLEGVETRSLNGHGDGEDWVTVED